jgi:peptidoglycan hydrolase CwlO-like protein
MYELSLQFECCYKTCYFCMVCSQVTQLQSQLAHKDADIASLADKLEAAVEAAANATRAAAAQQQQPGSAAARGVADEEARKAVALAQTQVGSLAAYYLAVLV